MPFTGIYNPPEGTPPRRSSRAKPAGGFGRGRSFRPRPTAGDLPIPQEGAPLRRAGPLCVHISEIPGLFPISLFYIISLPQPDIPGHPPAPRRRTIPVKNGFPLTSCFSVFYENIKLCSDTNRLNTVERKDTSYPVRIGTLVQKLQFNEEYYLCPSPEKGHKRRGVATVARLIVLSLLINIIELFHGAFSIIYFHKYAEYFLGPSPE